MKGGKLEIIAHRGVPRERPENTLPSFALALERGVRAIEIDVHATRDGVVVVHHDPELRATDYTDYTDRAGGAGGAGKRAIAEMTWDELGAARPRSGVAVPRLEQVLELVKGRGTLYVEIKGAGATRPVAEMLAKAGGTHAVHSFDHRVAVGTRKVAPGVPTGILLCSYLLEPARALEKAGARDYWVEWNLVDAQLVSAVHGAGGRVIAWTVNDIEAARRFVAMGVDGICSDVPHEMRVLRDGA